MHDGQNVFDPETSSFGYDWCADEVADSLIKAGAINEILIVAINNTEDRGSEYVYTSLGYAYMDFIVNKLKPFIDNEYERYPAKKILQFVVHH
jgi:predicted alpha/beta superfamily hydrolase